MIDFCCDIGNYAFRQWPAHDAASTLPLMDRAGIDIAVVGSTDAITYVSPHPANERLMADIKANGLREPIVIGEVMPGLSISHGR